MKLGIQLITGLILLGSLGLKAQNKIDLLILNKNYKSALLALEKMESTNASEELFFKKGIIYENQQDYQKAISAFNQGLKINPNNFGINSEMAECLTILGNYSDAIQYYKQALHLQQNNLILKGKMGRTYINMKEYKDAFQIFSEIYASDSSNIYWNKQLAFCSFKTGKKERAKKLYEMVIEQNPRDLSSYLNLSHLYDRKKEQEKVVDLLTRGLTQFNGNKELYLEFARLYFGSKQYKLAMEQYENYFSSDGERDYKIQLNYAISCYFAKDEKKSLEALALCSIMSPNDPFVLFYKSLNFKRLANYPDAEKFMQYAIDSSYPDFLPEMYHHLGQIFGAQRKFTESVDALKKAYELNPQKHEILFEIATTYEEFNSNKTLALNYYQIYLKEAGEGGKNVNYALDRITRLKEDLFFEE